MESSLHRQLKSLYAGQEDLQEVPWGRYRIDVVSGDQLIEIQHGPLAAIRAKVARLVVEHPVLVVKPVIARLRIAKLRRKGGPVVSRRWSPKRRNWTAIFDELVHFVSVFPHQNLTLQVPCIEVEQRRYPGHGRRRYRRATDFQIEDQELLRVVEERSFRTPDDLLKLIPGRLPATFDTAQLAEQLGEPRWIGQRMAYCLRHAGAIRQVGKRGNSLLYELR